MSVERFGLDPDGKLGLSEDDVVCVRQKWFGLQATMIKLDAMMNYLASWATASQQLTRDTHPWFTEMGSQCEILRNRGGGWQQGRFRIRLEFIPDNPEEFFKNSSPEEEKPQPPVDDLRSQLDNFQSQLDIE